MSTKALAGYAKYDSYQDSGVDWLGDIPEDWQLLKVRNIFRLSNKFAEKNNSHELLSVYTDIGVKPRRELEARGNKASTTDGYLIVEKGDIVVNKLLAWMGAIGYSNYDGVTSPAYDILKPTRPVSSMFYHFLFRTPRCVSELKRNSRGIMDMRLRLYFDKFGNVLVPYPSLEEQEKIISFLNNETDKIDQAIELKQQQINKLRQYKQAIIEKALTKGLNPHVITKSSGIEWIGEIPTHWSMKKLKNCLSQPVAGVWGEEATGTKDSVVLRVADFDREKLSISDEKLTYRNISDNDFINRKLSKGDLLVEKSGGGDKTLVGCVVLFDKDYPAVTSNFVAKITPQTNFSSKFFVLLFSHLYSIKRNYLSIKQTTGIQNLDIASYLNEYFCFPAYEEQLDIVNFLEEKLPLVEQSIFNFKKQIDCLREYKSILINQAVTGKIKVS